MTETRIFVFGSNLAGYHDGGAALFARQNRGAIYGQGIGLQGQSYAIPTLDGDFEQLRLDEITRHVRDFLAFAYGHPEMRFQVTPIGTGLAGFTHQQIAPMFKRHPPNCEMPKEWLKI